MLCMVLCAACTPQTPPVPSNVSVGGAASLPAPPAAPNDAPPRIVAIRFSSLDVKRPAVWSGRFITSTNVASVEVRTNQFSIDVPRRTFGDFAFDLNVLDVPAEFIRRYDLRVIARNSAGDAVEEDMPFRIR